MNIHVIILVGQERLHIRRCLEKLAPLEPTRVYLVTSQPDDGTLAIAQETAAACGLDLAVLHHDWPGLQSAQYNWAVNALRASDKCEVISDKCEEWILRLDADEYLYPETIAEIKEKLGKLGEDVTGVILKRRHVVGWLGDKWVKRGMYPTKLLRLYRMGCGVCEQRCMDEHIALTRGRAVEFDGDFADHNLGSFADWLDKHRGYAQREAKDGLEILARLKAGDWSEFGSLGGIGEQAAERRKWKYRYYACPTYVRAIVYFLVRFLVCGAIFEGLAAWKWCWYHALWYRWQCDKALSELRKTAAERSYADSGVDLRLYRNWHGLKNQIVRLSWSMVWMAFARWTPRFVLNRYRALILRCFGARVGTGCRLTSSMEVWIPSRLRMGSHVWIDKNVNLYDVERITIGDNVIISDGAYICTATHDVTSRAFELVTAPVTIKSCAWIAAKAIVLPGVTIGEGAVVGAGAVVTKDVEPWAIVAGNPARVVRKRELKG